MTKALVAVSPPAPEKNEEPAPVALEQAVPHGEAFGVVPGAWPDRELTEADWL